MPLYTFQPQLNDDAPDERLAFTHQLPGDAAAIENGRSWFTTLKAFPAKASLEIGLGAGDDIEWLGAWDWEYGQEPTWSPND